MGDPQEYCRIGTGNLRKGKVFNYLDLILPDGYLSGLAKSPNWAKWPKLFSQKTKLY